jgi:hypothetical protein
VSARKLKKVHKEIKTRKNARFTSDDDEANSSYKKKKKKQKKKEYRKREEYFCKYHGPNPTHDSDTCKVLLAKGQDKPAWKDNKKDYKDFKSKYKNKSRDLNILQKEVRQTKSDLQKEKHKWVKANERLQSRKKSKSDSSSKDETEETEQSHKQRQPDAASQQAASSSSSSSDSSSDSNSEYETGCSETY